MPLSRIEQLIANDTRDREATARMRAADALDLLAEQGVAARVIGSLARGDFRLHSDVDLLVLRCPSALRYRIEGLVEDALQGLPFDVVYLDEVKPERRADIQRRSLDAFDLR